MNCRRMLVFFFLAVLVEQTLSAPLIKTDDVTPRIEDAPVEGTTEGPSYKGITDKEGAAEYLKKYGYYKPGISKNSNSPRDELRESIKRMQKFLNLNVTGELDNETLAVMNSKRCSFPDVMTGADGRQKRYETSGVRWGSRYLTYKVLSYPSTTQMFNSRSEIDSAIDEGFKIWTLSAYIFITRSNSSSANMKLSFYKGSHGDLDPFNQTILAHAFYPEDGRIHFNDNFTWSKYDNYNLKQIVAHESGHAIGLAHSSDLSAIMYPIHHYKTDFKLAYDDVRGIRSLYGKP